MPKNGPLRRRRRTEVVNYDKNSKFFQIDTWWEKKVNSLGERIKDEFPFLLVKKPNKTEKENIILFISGFFPFSFIFFSSRDNSE